MTDSLAAGHPAIACSARPAAAEQAHADPDPGRRLQLALAGIWLLDGILQFQPVMFTRAFGQMLASTAAGNPAFVAGPIRWIASEVGRHPAPLNLAFASVQVLLGLGIAWRPTVRVALAASVGWSLAVWWLGEGLGLVLTGTASPVNGGPGAVLIYALLAILLWPREGQRPADFVAGRSVGKAAACLTWLGVWGVLAALAVQPDAAAPMALSRSISAMAAGQPGWLGSADQHLATALSGRGAGASMVLALVLCVIAAGIWLPPGTRRWVIALAVGVSAWLWLAQGLGGLLTGSATDPGSAPLLALLACAYWPASSARANLAARRPGEPPQ